MNSRQAKKMQYFNWLEKKNQTGFGDGQSLIMVMGTTISCSQGRFFLSSSSRVESKSCLTYVLTWAIFFVTFLGSSHL